MNRSGTVPGVDFRIDHIGLQVRDIGAAVQTFSALLGYVQATEPVVNSRQRVEVVFLEKPGSLPLKVFRPLDGSGSHPAKLHHLALRVDDVAEALEVLTARGARVISAPAPGEAFDDEPIAFVFAGGFNFELVSTERRRSRIQPHP